MAARSTIAVLDRAGTPATHNFTPDGDDPNGVHVFTEKTGIPAADARITASLRFSGSKYKPTLKFTVPVVATQVINGISTPVVQRTAYGTVEFTFDSTSTLQERKDTVSYVEKALAAGQTMINDLLVNVSDIY